MTPVLLCIRSTKFHLSTPSLASQGDTDYDSAAANTQIPSEPQQVDSLSRSVGDNKTNYSIMGIIPLFHPKTAVLDRWELAGWLQCGLKSIGHTYRLTAVQSIKTETRLLPRRVSMALPQNAPRIALSALTLFSWGSVKWALTYGNAYSTAFKFCAAWSEMRKFGRTFALWCFHLHVQYVCLPLMFIPRNSPLRSAPLKSRRTWKMENKISFDEFYCVVSFHLMLTKIFSV